MAPRARKLPKQDLTFESPTKQRMSLAVGLESERPSLLNNPRDSLPASKLPSLVREYQDMKNFESQYYQWLFVNTRLVKSFEVQEQRAKDETYD